MFLFLLPLVSRGVRTAGLMGLSSCSIVDRANREFSKIMREQQRNLPPCSTHDYYRRGDYSSITLSIVFLLLPLEFPDIIVLKWICGTNACSKSLNFLLLSYLTKKRKLKKNKLCVFIVNTWFVPFNFLLWSLLLLIFPEEHHLAMMTAFNWRF